MKREPHGWLYSSQDLQRYVTCPTLLARERLLALGQGPMPDEADEMTRLLFTRGDEHEQAHADRLEAKGLKVLRLDPDRARPDYFDKLTCDAIAQAPDVIAQAPFHDGTWQGTADFLIRVPAENPGEGTRYEPMDTKLALKSRPQYMLQLAHYAEHLARLQAQLPRQVHVTHGNGQTESIPTSEIMPWYRHVKGRFLEWMEAADNATGPTMPEPVPQAYCGQCRWRSQCEAWWQERDPVHLLPGIRRATADRLVEAGFATVAALGRTQAGDSSPPLILPETWQRLSGLARLQVAARSTGKPQYGLRPPVEGRGLAAMPEPDIADVYFDIEGDPLQEGGQEYLLGWWYRNLEAEGSPWTYQHRLAHDRQEERSAFEAFMDFISHRLYLHPRMHVLHYAAYEPSALKRLASRHASREDELDHLLRCHVFTDLYRTTHQGILVSQPGYSLKQLETYWAGTRTAAVTTSVGSIVEYAAWRATQDNAILERIVAYNKEDCEALAALHRWLLGRRSELEREVGPIPWPSTPDTSTKATIAGPSGRRVADTTTRTLALAAAFDGEEAKALHLMAALLGYHQRERRPQWWDWFHQQDLDIEGLIDDLDCLGDLTRDDSVPPRISGTNVFVLYRFPEQQTRLPPQDKADIVGARPGDSPIVVGRISLKEGWIELPAGLPAKSLKGLTPTQPIPLGQQPHALERLARAIPPGGLGALGEYRACRDLLLGAAPRFLRKRGLPKSGEVLIRPTRRSVLEQASSLCRALDESTLVVQGPPGTGKTWLGARLIADLLANGSRVGIAAQSHKVIHNLLAEVEAVLQHRGLTISGVKKSSPTAGSSYTSSHHMIRNVSDTRSCFAIGNRLIAGTSYLFSHPAADRQLDYIFIDEAGQVSLADALAMGTAARNIVLLGDPQQLPQVTRGVHPEGSDVSALARVLNGRDTIPPKDGIFLETTYRMHPALTEIVSRLAYEGRLQAAKHCAHQAVRVSGYKEAGCQWSPVDHEGREGWSPEEVEAVARHVKALLGGMWVDRNGTVGPLAIEDILVISPYNLQVRMLEQALPPGIRVGTVDKFQGQEAPVTIYSLACSDARLAARGISFLLSRNRLNVAISRAQGLSLVVGSPSLLDAPCRTIEQIRLVSGLCMLAQDSRPES